MAAGRPELPPEVSGPYALFRSSPEAGQTCCNFLSSAPVSRTCSILLTRTESDHILRQSMFPYPRHNIELFIEHLKNAKQDSSLNSKIQEDAQTLISHLSQKILESEQEYDLSALDLVSFSDLPDTPMGKVIENVSDDDYGYGKVVEFLRARSLASRGSQPQAL
jgi:hypothetical protein